MPKPVNKEQPKQDERKPLEPVARSKVVGGLVSLIALTLIALTLASFFSRYDWHADLLTHFRLQYTVVLLVTTLALAVLRWKKMAAISLLGLFANLYFVAPMFVPPSHPPAITQLATDESAAT